MHCGNVHVVALETKMIHVPKSIKCMCVGRKQSKVKTSLKRNERDPKNYYVPATHLIVRERGGGGGGFKTEYGFEGIQRREKHERTVTEDKDDESVNENALQAQPTSRYKSYGPLMSQGKLNISLSCSDTATGGYKSNVPSMSQGKLNIRFSCSNRATRGR